MPLLWVGKWVDQRAEGGLLRKGEGLLEVENHGFLVEPGTKEWMMDIITTGQSRPRRGPPRILRKVGFGIRRNQQSHPISGAL